MKKILVSLVSLLFLFSCAILPRKVVINNNEVNYYASKHMNRSINLIAANANIYNLKTRVENGLLYSDIAYNYSVLGGVVDQSQGVIKTVSSLEVRDNKLYVKAPQILSVTTNNNQPEKDIVSRALISVVLNTFANNPLHDFKNDYYVKKVYMTNDSIVFDTE